MPQSLQAPVETNQQIGLQLRKYLMSAVPSTPQQLLCSPTEVCESVTSSSFTTEPCCWRDQISVRQAALQVFKQKRDWVKPYDCRQSGRWLWLWTSWTRHRMLWVTWCQTGFYDRLKDKVFPSRDGIHNLPCTKHYDNECQAKNPLDAYLNHKKNHVVRRLVKWLTWTYSEVCVQPWCNPLCLTGLKAPTN